MVLYGYTTIPFKKLKVTKWQKTQRNTPIEMTMTKALAFTTKEHPGKHVAKGDNGDTFKVRPGGVNVTSKK